MLNSEGITRTSSAYDAMKCQGVIAGSFKGNYFQCEGWEMAFYMGALDPERAKNVATEYLEREYDAINIYFFRKKGEIETKFYARFTRRDL